MTRLTLILVAINALMIAGSLTAAIAVDWRWGIPGGVGLVCWAWFLNEERIVAWLGKRVD